MTQSSPTIGANKSGLSYRQEDNDGKTALLNHHKGSGAPDYAEAGVIWLDDSATPWLLKMHDGADWIVMGEINAGTNAFQPYQGASTLRFLNYAADTGAANAYAIAPSPAISAYAAGQAVTLKPGNANTGSATLAVSSLAAKNIKLPDGTSPLTGAMLTGGIYILVYDGTNFVLTNSSFVPNTQLLARGAAIASAATVDLGAAGSDYVEISGTTAITSFGTTLNRNHAWVKFQGALTLTHDGTALILPGAANITTAAGDTAEFVRISGGNWQCITYARASGKPLTPPGTSDLPAGTVVGRAYATYASWAAVTTMTPFDDTVPQNTESTQIMSQSYTPQSASNRIRVTTVLFYGVTNLRVVASLFIDSATSAADTALQYVGSTVATLESITMVYEHVPGDTSAHTYNVRLGPAMAGSIYTNGNSAGRLMGGATSCKLIIEEIKA